MAHDKCRNTANYKIAGQNLYESCAFPNSPSIADGVNKAMEGWFNEYKDVPNINEVRSLGSSRARKPIGHWTQFVQSKADRVGCSVVKYNDQSDWKCILVACNYNAGNLMQKPIYNIGAPASQCQTGNNPKYPGLCSENENFAQHENGELYFQNAGPSPVVAQWMNNGKKLDLGGSIATMQDDAKTNQPQMPNTIQTGFKFNGNGAQGMPMNGMNDMADDFFKKFTGGSSSGMQSIRVETRYVNGVPVTTRYVNGKPVPDDGSAPTNDMPKMSSMKMGPMSMHLKQFMQG